MHLSTKPSYKLAAGCTLAAAIVWLSMASASAIAAPADQPAPQSNAKFAAAHAAFQEKATQGGIDVYFEGDSITRRWQGADYPEHQKNWNQNFFGWNAADFGWGGDTTANVLFRLNDGELDGVNPRVIVLLIGTNNIGNVPQPDDTALVADVARGIEAILNVLHEKAPSARIILTGITPRNDDQNHGTALMPTVNKINAAIAKFADGDRVHYININDKLADDTGRLREGMTEDRLHLSTKGYQVWADALKPVLTEWLGPPAETGHAPPASAPPKDAAGSD
jgi:lysophospholipase L1-like esterase